MIIAKHKFLYNRYIGVIKLFPIITQADLYSVSAIQSPVQWIHWLSWRIDTYVMYDVFSSIFCNV